MRIVPAAAAAPDATRVPGRPDPPRRGSRHGARDRDRSPRGPRLGFPRLGTEYESPARRDRPPRQVRTRTREMAETAAGNAPPAFRKGVRVQDFARTMLGVADLARELMGLYADLKKRAPDGVLTAHVRRMSVSLRSLILDRKGRLLERVFEDGWLPALKPSAVGLLAKEVVDASPYQEVGYEIEATGERRTLRVPGYRHAFVVDGLPGIGKDGGNRYAILPDGETWSAARTLDRKDWVGRGVFEVDGLVYDVEECIKCVANKEGAHIDDVVLADGIYTGNSQRRRRGFTKDDAYTLSRMVKFGPLTYTHIVAILVTRHLVGAIARSVSARADEVGSILRQFTLTGELVASTREGLEVIAQCPQVGTIGGLPLRVRPERLVMREPIPMGLESFEEEQALADALPRYGESYVGCPRAGRHG